MKVNKRKDAEGERSMKEEKVKEGDEKMRMVEAEVTDDAITQVTK